MLSTVTAVATTATPTITTITNTPSSSSVHPKDPPIHPFLVPSSSTAAALEQLQAGAFRSLIQHLQDYSHDISNIDLMTLAGFCRNCLAKVRTSYMGWMNTLCVLSIEMMVVCVCVCARLSLFVRSFEPIHSH